MEIEAIGETAVPARWNWYYVWVAMQEQFGEKKEGIKNGVNELDRLTESVHPLPTGLYKLSATRRPVHGD